MATAAPPAAKAHSDPGASFLQSIAAQNPANTPLSAGLQADPTYLAFLRGAGYSYNQALQLAAQNEAQARSTYQTANSRLPEQLRQAQESTDTGLLDRGVWRSGERLVRENRNVVANQEAGQDLLSQRAAAIQGAQSTLQGTLADLARARADAEGGLQDRMAQRANQDKYINAVRGAAQSGGSGGGGGSFTISAPTPPAPAVGPAPPKPAGTGSAGITGGSYSMPDHAAAQQPALAPGEHINDYIARPDVHNYLAGLDNQGQSNWLKFMQAQYPGADFRPVLLTLASVQQGQGQGQQSASQQGLRSSGAGHPF